MLRISEPYKRASRTFKPEDTIVSIDDVRVGGDEVIVMAGPCSAETEEQVHASAAAVKKAGAKILRGGAFKPRSSPYSFQGMAEEGLKLLKEASEKYDMPFITEVMTPEQMPLVSQYADILQIGAPEEIYQRPNSRAVAAFFGSPNLLDAKVAACVATSEITAVFTGVRTSCRA